MTDDFDQRRIWRERGSLPRHEQTAIVLLGMGLAAWAFDRCGSDALALVIALSILAIAIAAAWYARSID